MSFTDQIAVITGGASGISHATAQKLAAAGATVCIGDIHRRRVVVYISRCKGKCVVQEMRVFIYLDPAHSGIAEGNQTQD